MTNFLTDFLSYLQGLPQMAQEMSTGAVNPPNKQYSKKAQVGKTDGFKPAVAPAQTGMDMQGLMGLMQMMGQQQGQNIEAMLRPRGRIAESPKNASFGKGLERWEQMNPNAPRGQAAIDAARGKGQKLQQYRAQNPGRGSGPKLVAPTRTEDAQGRVTTDYNRTQQSGPEAMLREWENMMGRRHASGNEGLFGALTSMEKALEAQGVNMMEMRKRRSSALGL